jgi:hypothetical protein
MKHYLLIALILGLFAGQSFAGYIFYDDFNTEHGGVGVLNYANFNKWTVSDGTVDLIGNGFYDFGLSGNGHGLFVDMDGSTGNAGTMMSTTLNLNPGTYTLSFDLAGNHRNSSTEKVNVSVVLGSLFSESFSLSQNAPFTTFTRSFNVLTTGSYKLKFEGVGGDNIGMLLDNVSVVPIPATVLLGLIGLGVGGWKLRKSV